MFLIVALLTLFLSIVDLWLVHTGVLVIVAKIELISQFYYRELPWIIALFLGSVSFVSSEFIDNKGAPFRTIFCVICLFIQFVTTVIGLIVWRSGHAALASFTAFGVYYGNDTPQMILLIISSLFLTACPMLCWWASLKSRQYGQTVSNMFTFVKKASLAPRGGPRGSASRARAESKLGARAWRFGDQVRWKDRVGIYHRDTGDGEHSEILVDSRVYRVPTAELG